MPCALTLLDSSWLGFSVSAFLPCYPSFSCDNFLARNAKRQMLTNIVVFPVHAYNEHLPPSTGGIEVHTHNHALDGIATNSTADAAITSGGVRPLKPTGSRPKPKPHSRFSGIVAIPSNATFGVPDEAASSDIFASPTEGENGVHAVPHDMYMAYGPRSPSYAYGTSPFDGGDGYEGVQGGGYEVDVPEVAAPATHTPHNQTPVLIKPLSFRKRVDAMAGGHQKSSIPMPLLDTSPIGSGIDLDALLESGLGSPISRKERGLLSYAPRSSMTGQPFIHLTYVPPKKAEDNSLFETDTELEADACPEDLGFETEVEEGFQEEEPRMGMGQWKQEQEIGMGTPMLSRSRSTASGGGGTRPVRGRIARRASVGVVAVDLHRRKIAGYAVNHNTGKKFETTLYLSGSSRPRTRSKPADDPSIYIRRRGSLHAPSSAKKFLGWEYPVHAEKKVGGGDGGLRRGWAEKVGAASCVMAREMLDNVQQEQESSFIDLKGDHGFAKSVGLSLGSKAGGGGGGKEERKAEEGGSDAVEAEKNPIKRAPRRKLKKRSKSSSRPSTADSAFAPPVSCPKQTSIKRPLCVALAAAAPINTPPTSQWTSGAFGLERLGHHRLASGSSTADSEASKASYGSASGKDVVKRGLQLKKNFKLGVGRTLGPNLTLAVGMCSKVVVDSTRKAKQRTSSIVAESTPEGDDDSDEIMSISAAKLVSATIARAAPAPTILATPTSGGDLPMKGRPTSAVNVTPHPFSAPGLSYTPHTAPPISLPASAKTTATAPNKRKPHPFADFVERNHVAEVANDVEDDVVQLEHEMEAIRSRRGDTEKDSPKLHVAGGILQKRVTLSSPPAPKSEWAHQPSSAQSTAGGFRFPMIFGNDPPSSSMYQHTQQSTSQVRLQTSSTASTPRGQSTMKLSAVRNAFAGVGARMSSRMSNVPSTTRGGTGSTFNEIVMENDDGDFMDLRDPFASSPAAATLVAPTKTLKNGARAKEGDNFLVIDAYGPDDVESGDGRRRMSAWGTLPMPTRPFSPAAANPGTSAVGAKRNTNSSNRSSRSGAKAAVGHRKQKKERRAKKTTLPSMASALGPMKGVISRVGEEDADFSIEEALLSQRLLKRLDADGWESRA